MSSCIKIPIDTTNLARLQNEISYNFFVVVDAHKVIDILNFTIFFAIARRRVRTSNTKPTEFMRV